MMKSKLLSLSLLGVLLLAGCGETTSEEPSETPALNGYQIKEGLGNDGGVFYEIFVRAFSDASDSLDGVGDFRGVEEKIPYLETLGVSGVWFMPIMDSSSYHGYNVNDYYAVEPDYGTMADFESMMAAFDEADIDVILDLVINHSGHLVDWFVKSAAYVTGENESPEYEYYADWYTWSEGKPNSAPGTYREYDNSGWWYLANFDSIMPDLNLDNPDVRAEILKIAKFWLDKGVSGFRLDATLYFYEQNIGKNIAFLEWFTSEVKKMKPDAYIVGETWAATSIVAPYYESGIDSQFWFDGALTDGVVHESVLGNNGKLFANEVANYDQLIKTYNPYALNSAFLSNHDNNRSAGYAAWALSDNKKKLAASLYLLTPGVPFMYYGEEIGLKGSGIDENKRLPMVWQEAYSNNETVPVANANYDMFYQVTLGAHDLLEDPWSLTNHYRKVISIRNEFPGIKHAVVEAVDLGSVPLAGLKLIEDSLPNREILIVHNLGKEEHTFAVDGKFEVLAEINTEQIEPVVGSQTITLAKNSSIIITKGT